MSQSSIQTTLVQERARSHTNREIMDFWQKIYNTTMTCPTYAQFNLRTLEKYADTLLVLQPLDDGDFYYTYFGTWTGIEHRGDLTGCRHSELKHPIAQELAQHFKHVVATGEPMLALHSSLRSRSVHTWEHAILPVDSPVGRLLINNMVPVIFKTDLIESIVQSTPGGIIACALTDDVTPDLRRLKVIMANAAAERLFDLPSGALVGRHVLDFIHGEARDAVESACLDVIVSGQQASLKLDLANRYGEPPQDLTISPFDGGLVLTFAELGALRRAYQDLERRECELSAMKSELGRQEATLATLAEQIAEARRSYDQEVGQRRRLEAELRRLAETDDLTGRLNRRAFFRELQAELHRSARYGHPPSLLYLDIDRFKAINDTRGHAAGDAIIRGVIERIVSVLRHPVDLIGRLGGDEFAVMLPETDAAGAETVAERIRQIVADTPFAVLDQTIAVTVSIGFAAWNDGKAVGGKPEAVDDWVARADEALYEAKNSGRNAVHLAAALALDPHGTSAENARMLAT